MEPTILLSIGTNVAIIAFLVWSLLRRKNVDERIDRLAGLLNQVVDTLAKHRSWEKSAEEVTALEGLYDRKLKAAISAHEAESLQTVKKIKLAEMEARRDLAIIEGTIQALPRDIRSTAYAILLRSGIELGERPAKVYFTSHAEINDALQRTAATVEHWAKNREAPSGASNAS